jgi:drug/metabolite transporter (DMT)-like permease
MVKLISDHVSIWQLYLARAIIVLGLLSGLVGAFRPLSGIKLVNPFWAALRSVFMGGAFVLFYLAMPFVSLSQAAAAFFTGPLFITLLSAVFTGERIGPRRIVALLLGFAGVLVIIQPWGDGLQLALLLPLAAAISYALAIVITRARCVEDSAVALSLVQNVVFAQIGLAALIILDITAPSESRVAGYPFLFAGWGPAPLLVWAMIMATAVTHMIGAIILTRVYQTSDSSRIAPLEYSYLAIVPVLDLVIWRVVPSGTTILGMILIALAGAFVAWREGTPPRPRPQTHEEVPG